MKPVKVIKWVLFVLMLTVISLSGFFVFTKPSNNRNWEVGMDLLPKFNIRGNQVDVENLRDFRFDKNGPISKNYVNKGYDASKITKVWFVQEPFIIKPFTNFGGVAHTYFVFDFADQEPVVVSVEARREKAEKYDAWSGLFNKYELIYIWGTEQDETVQRIVVQNNKLYMYPLQISQLGAQKLFLQLAQTSHDLETSPRFYNTLTSNCTNELAKAANEVKPGAVPFNRALFFPGYSDIELHKLGFIPNDLAIDEERKKYSIADSVKQNYQKPDFSDELRNNIEN